MRGLALGIALCVTTTALAQTDRFEVVSVKANTGTDLAIHFSPHPPDGFRQINTTLDWYVGYAYGITQFSRVSGLPEWTRNTRFDVVARAAGPITDTQRRAMLRDVLASRFALRAHMESEPQTVYVLSAARADHRLGPGLTPRPECATTKCESGGSGRADGVDIRAVTLAQLADGMLSNILRQVVRDETRIDGVFDVKASWRPDAAADDPNDDRPSVFTAVQEQLGLRLDAQKRPVDVLVVDAIQRPTAD